MQIVSIYQVHKTKQSCLKLINRAENAGDEVESNNNEEKDIRLEVRWLYKRNEIPGVKKSASPGRSLLTVLATNLDEVFETDHLDVVTADSILSPVVLHERQQRADELDSTIDGLPCIHYCCSRFWSLHRKSFVPIGSFSKMQERGLMHSAFFGERGTAKSALGRLKGIESLPKKRPLSWREAFQSAIKTLSLAEAAQDVQLRGIEMACRDKERKEVFSFLKTAVCGRQVRNSQGDVVQSMAIKNSMFIAGPPGTGMLLF